MVRYVHIHACSYGDDQEAFMLDGLISCGRPSEAIETLL